MSKKTIKRIISLSLAASSLLGGTYQLGIDGNSNYVSSITAEAIAEECDCKSNSDYCVNCFIEKMTELSGLAKEYIKTSWQGTALKSKNYTNGRADLWFTFAYIRRIVYNSDSNIEKWGYAAGVVRYENFKGFTDYIKVESPELYEFTSNINSKTSFHIKNMDEKFEIGHMCATISALLFTGETSIKSLCDVDYINQLSGWAGDYQTLMNSAYKATYIDKKYDKIEEAFASQMGSTKYSFSTADLFSDVASYEIGKIAISNPNIDMNTLLKSYFTSSEAKYYVAKFCESISVKDVMKYTNPYKAFGEKIDQLKYTFKNEDRYKMANAFSNYLKENYGSSIGFAVDIVKQPTDVSVEFGKGFSTTVTATGDGITYQWYLKNKNGTEFTKSSITTADYTTVMNEERNGRQVYCIITDKYGNSVQTDTVTLFSKVTITEQPQNVQAPIGGSVKTTVTALGEELTYQWYYKNIGMTEFKLSSIKSKTYDCPMTEDRDGRQVYCVITDKYGNSVQTNTVTLNSKVTITEDLVDVTAKFGEKVNFSVSATGHGLTYKWYFKNKNMKNFEVTETFKTNTYSFDQMTEARAGREVYCEITDIFGNTEKTKTIKIDLPTGYGDANCDGELTIDDADAIMKAFANPDQYGLTEQGKINADVSGEGDVTLSDALLIQQYFAN